MSEVGQKDIVVQENPKPKDPSAKDPKQEYENAAKAAVEDIDSDNEYAPSDDSLNFLVAVH